MGKDVSLLFHLAKLNNKDVCHFNGIECSGVSGL
jgi:hypothetical protein